MATKTAQRRKPNNSRQRSDAVVNIRISKTTRELIDTAAAASGKTRSEFMLESARREAIDTLLDQRLFALDGKQYRAFLAVLENPPPPGQKLRELFTAKAPWER